MNDLYFEYWEHFLEYTNSSDLYANFTRKNQGRYYYCFSLKQGNNDICFSAKQIEKIIGCELYLKGSDAKYIFNELEKRKDEIEKELSLKLDWQKLPNANDSRIIIIEKENINDKAKWSNQFKWLLKHGENFRRVFYKYIKDIKLKQ